MKRCVWHDSLACLASALAKQHNAYAYPYCM